MDSRVPRFERKCIDFLINAIWENTEFKRRVKGPEERENECLELDARFCNSSERGGLPVGLLCLLPHDHVEAGAGSW